MIRHFSIFLLTVAPLLATDEGIIRGMVVEASTNKVLARATVVLEPMPGTLADTRTVRADRLGQFKFEYLPAGYYSLKASRRGYISAEYGQKRWNSAGQVISLAEKEGLYAPLRLHYYGAISGTVVDENDIGLPGHEVGVYRAVQPPEFIRTTTADDRGVYRIGGLEPGRYFIRTVAKQYEEGGYLPTFSRESIRPDQAQVTDILLEQQTDRVDVRPIQGRLYSLTVKVVPDYEDTEMTLASGMGRTTVKSAEHVFAGLPAGEYEVYAKGGGYGAYQRLMVSGDSKLSLVWSGPSKVTVRDGPSKDVKLRMRRRDLAGAGLEVVTPVADSLLFPGRWELMLTPPEGYYASDFFPRAQGRADGWIEVTMRPHQDHSYTLNAGAASVHGMVKDTPFALVYLEGWDPAARKRAGDLKVVRADQRGQYRFGSVAPGSYRLLSTFEYLNPSSEIFDASSAVGLTVERSSDQTRDLELWGIR